MITLTKFQRLVRNWKQNTVVEPPVRGSGYNNSIAASLEAGFVYLKKSNALATEYLCVIATLDNGSISLSILPSCRTAVEQHDALELLRRHSGITEHPDDQTIAMHRLTHWSARVWVRTSGVLGYWTTKAAGYLNDSFPSPMNGNRLLWRSYLSYANQLLNKAAATLIIDGKYREAEDMFKEISSTQNKYLDENREITSFPGMNKGQDEEQCQSSELAIVHRRSLELNRA
ncbi:uncharacterized protein BDV17DRAFT_290226 [Aspergillus undulatus]|uniref:uncharacterized protein n=1 Tax=Aspergillus undulatus TaxID=1810928 RepID=UPI003CCD693D